MTKKQVMTTGIGSLPHINIDSALAYSFRHDLAFLPQLPKYNSNEFMLYQGLSKLPGIEKPEAGISSLNLKTWLKGRPEFLSQAQNAIAKNDYSYFSPSANTYSCLNGFLFELSERELSTAKLQIIGPFTAIQSLRLLDNSPVFEYKDIIEDVELCLYVSARALIEKTLNYVEKIVFFIDEPALFMFSPKNMNMLESYKALINLSRKLSNVKDLSLGLHSCHAMNWTALSSENLFKYNSFDIQAPGDLLSLYNKQDYSQLCIGSVPTNLSSKEKYQSLVPEIVKELSTEKLFDKNQALLLSAACGLAYRNIEDTETILSALKIDQDFLLHL